MTFLAAVLGATAQDTVFWGERADRFYNYYIYGNAPDVSYNSTVSSTSPFFGGEQGILFHTPDSLTVYGIAAAIQEDTVFTVLDYNYDSSYEYLRLYYPNADSLEWINQKKFYLHRDISYYLNFDTVNPPRRQSQLSEMHECYFNRPTTVIDTFYVGLTLHLEVPVSGTSFVYQYPPILNSLLSGLGVSNNETMYIYFYYPNRPSEWRRAYRTNRFTIIFPILAPDPSAGRDTVNIGGDTTAVGDTVFVFDTTIFSDTTIIDDDTIVTYDTIITCDTILGIQDYGLLDRLTGVMPNPAAETARVVSSFGISRVAAYSMDGRRVADIKVPDNALSTTLDVGRWPTGTYILRIHTPMGIATKKLSVYR